MQRLVCAAALLIAFAACGEQGVPASPSSPATGPIEGEVVGQEIWLTYFSPENARYGRRVHRTAEEARALAETLRARVVAGEDIGALAEEYSNAPGAAARGFSGVLPADAEHPSARDRALASVAVGEVTPIVDWLGGMWFARRVDLEEGAALHRLFEQAGRERRMFRAIALLYRGAYLPERELAPRATRSLPRAKELAAHLLERLRAGEDFEALAREYSDDPGSAENGGLVTVPRSDGTRTPWVHRFETWVPESVLRAVFSTPPGELHPHVIVSPRGIFLIRVEERRFEDQ